MRTFPDVLPEKRLQFLAGGDTDHVRHIGRIKGGGDLRVEVDSIHYDDYGGITELRVHPQFLGGEHHEQGFAAALKMPDETLLRVAPHHTIDDLVGGEILLVPADDFDAPVLLVSGEDSEVLQDVEHYLRLQHAGDGRPDMMKLAFLLVFLIAPRPPHVDGHANGPISEQPALRGE